MRTRPDREAHPPDLRLVPAALAAWAVVLVGIGLGPVASAVAAAVAVGTVWVGWARPVVVAAAGCAAAAALVVTAHALLVVTHPLVAPAQRGAVATVEVVVGDDPRLLRSPGFGEESVEQERVLIPATLRRATAGEHTWQVGGRVLLIAPAAGWSTLLPGQTVTADGMLAAAQRRDLTVAVLRVRGAPTAVHAPTWWQDGAGGLRAGLRTAAAAVLAPPEAGLLPGLAVGDTSALLTEVEDDFQASGLTHLTAVSGANLAIVGGAVLALLRLVRADPRLAAVTAAVAVVGFVVLARPSPSVVRAAVMAGVALLALASGRGRAAVPALATAVLVLLLVDPTLAVDPGFALSVLATGALVLLAPGWVAAMQARRVPRWAAEAVAVPLAAFAATAPVVAGLSGTVSPLSVIANLLAVPAVAPATVLGVLGAVLSPVAPSPAAACAWLAGPAVAWLVRVAEHTAAVPGATIPWPSGVVGSLVAAAAVLAVLVLGRSPRMRALMAAVLVGLLLVLVPTRVAPPGWPPADWAVVACDVGQGDAMVLATGVDGVAVVVDVGQEDATIDACLDRLGVHTIAAVVISHLHADHHGGLAGALRDRPTGGVAVGPARGPDWAMTEVTEVATAAGVPVVGVVAGQRLRWPGLVLDVLAPTAAAATIDTDDSSAVNDASVVLRATTSVGTVLLVGDIEPTAQTALLDSGTPLRSDVLKMPHHGSGHSSTAFLDAVAPRIVLVSVGAGNRHGHPDAGLLDHLARGGAVVHRTDHSGDTAVVRTGPPADDVVAAAGTALSPPGVPAVVARGDPLPPP